MCLIGYLRSEIGLGQAARNLAYACDAQRLPVSFRHVPLRGRENDDEFTTKCIAVPDRRANLLVTGLPSIMDLDPRDRCRGRVNILYPFWELGRVPDAWLDTTRLLRRDLGAVELRGARISRRTSTGRSGSCASRCGCRRFCPTMVMRRTTLRLYTYFDFDSFGGRKNPTAAVRAFQAAFAIGRRDVRLIVKVRGGQYSGDAGMRKWLNEDCVPAIHGSRSSTRRWIARRWMH